MVQQNYSSKGGLGVLPQENFEIYGVSGDF